MMGDERKSVQEMELLAPVTPVKPMVPGQRQIYQNGQVILPRQESYMPRFVEENRDEVDAVSRMGNSNQFEAGIVDEANRANQWTPPYKPPTQLSEITSINDSVHRSPPFSCGYNTRDEKNEAPNVKETDPFTRYNHIPFCDLLAMNNGGVPAMLGVNQIAMTSNAFLSDLNYQPTLMFDNQGIMGGAGNVLVEPYKTSGELQGSNRPEQDMLKQLSERIEIQQSGLSRNCWNSYDLNALPNPENELLDEDRPTNIMNAFPDGGGIPVCAPETPDQFKRLGNNVPGKTGLPADKQNASDNQVSVPGVDNWLGINETQSSTHSIAIESFNPDEGGNHDIDQIKTPQPKPRRKKHRPKVIREVKPKQTPKQTKPKPSDANETPTTQRRKYVRKNDTNTPSTTPHTRGAEGSTSKVPDSAVKSCRKSLNFDLEDRVKENSSAPRSRSTPSSEQHLQNQGKDVMDAAHEYDAYDISFRNNQILKDYMSMPEGKAQNASQPTKATPPQYESSSAIEYESLIKRDRRTITGSKRYSAGSVHPRDSFANDGEHVRGVKRVNSSLAEASNMARTNFTSQPTPSQVNHMYLGNAIFSGMHGMYFPEIYKKRRTEKVLKPNTSHTLPLENIRPATSSENYPREATKTSKYYYLPAPRFNITAEPSNQATTVVHSHQDKTHFMNWAEIDKLKKKKRSNVPTRVRDLDSLKGFAECREASRSTAKHSGKKNVETFSHPSSIGVLSIVSSAKRTGKRQSRKRSTKAKSITSSFDIVNKLSLDFHNAQQFAGNAEGPFLALPWKDTFPVDAVIEGMKQLNINKEASSVRFKEQNILVPYHFQTYQQNALVLYKRDGTVIPFEGTQASKRRSRAKVELDEETNRVWKLLLEDINNQGIDGTDEEKAKWWEDERKVFCGRVDSFIARMRLVQGDRHFSPWKGSVVDSVVGVFLTQNVSDHLSSSAFMSVAARFPVNSADKVRMHSKEEISPLVEEPELCIIDLNDNSESLAWNEKSVEGPSCDRHSRTLHDADVHEEKEVVSSKESHGSTNLKDEAWCCFSSSQEKPHESLSSRESEIASASADARRIDDVESSQHSAISYQNSVESPNSPKSGQMGSNMSLVEDLTTPSNPSSLNCSGSFVELLRMAEIPKLNAAYAPRDQVPSYQSDLPDQEGIKDADKPTQKACTTMLDSFSIVQNKCSTVYQIHVTEGCNLQGVDEEDRSVDSTRSSEDSITEQIKATESTVEIILHEKASESSLKPSPMVDNVCSCYVLEGEEMIIQTPRQPIGKQQDITNSQTEGSESSPKKDPNLPTLSGETVVTESTCASNSTMHNEFTPNPPLSGHNDTSVETHHPLKTDTSKQTKGRTRKKASFDWESLRKQAQVNGISREQTANTMDSVDWEAVRRADVHVVAETIKERGMNNVLAERIKEFLDRIVNDHGSINLEWLRDVPPDKAKEYLLSIRGLGLKSVECVRLLTLHQLAFPVDTNVGRIAVRLGWVPLQPLPESLQLHLLELYPILESIQKYLWPRLCKLDQKTLYELHYHMITFGKVFCTKKQPNCNACPLRGECRHFASAFASARLALPGPEERSIVPSNESNMFHQDPRVTISPLPMPLLMADHMSETKSDTRNCEPIVEIPASPEAEPEQLQMSEYDIEDALDEDPNEIPTIKLNLEQFTNTLQTYMHSNMELQGGDMSKALVALATEAASIPTPKLKNVNRLRTEHHVYELPDAHQLLRGLDKREPDDPCSYLLAIWTPGETANSIEHPEKKCNSQESGELCSDETCFYCNNQREANSQIVRGTLLIPCRTAMRGSFPLNGTYFQVNEVFADHDSSLNPIEVPREWIWNLPRRTVYFGTSIPSIFKGLSTEGIQHCFWRGYVCVRGFDQKLRAPRPLMARLHFPASKLARPRGRNSEQDV